MKSKYIFPILSIARTDSIDPPLVARDEKPSATSAADSCGHSGRGDWSGTSYNGRGGGWGDGGGWGRGG
ncbi:hypothetical protein N7537_010088 [Penicillium hordei]|uniref:Uncharacterized protein n=1 Tax=Penicillium hordei TaxID=40994 RepID=A0AAD6DVF1_9EURO|nr:uncharacterized protein N7537_010088 [Penicillium hordei]KAJ5593184.1 hypothetical protein N7537_010088 [Penicillium hordei]